MKNGELRAVQRSREAVNLLQILVIGPSTSRPSYVNAYL